MIFQAPIQLNIENKTVQVIIDLDTGLIGFTEQIDNNTIEYFFGESPVAFKTAFLEKLKPIIAEKSYANFKICRKNKTAKQIKAIIHASK